MYDAMFAVGLRFTPTKLYHSQIATNAWRIFLGAEVIWGQLSGGNHCLTLDVFFYFYKPQ